jgi:hypothetical protein
MTSWAVCAALLEQISQDERESLISFLSPSARSVLSASIPTDLNVHEHYPNPALQLEPIHPSWFAPFLRQLTEKDIRLFLAALKESQADALRRILRVNNYAPQLKEPGKEFLQYWIWHSLSQDAEDLLPISCLPFSKMHPLLACSHKELLVLMEYLGLYDLAYDVRRIIDTAKIKQIYACFSPEEITYLKKLAHVKNPVIFPSMGLQSWDGDAQFLKKAVLQRGVNRLAKATYEEHPSFLWHLVHHLDEEQGLLLKKLCTPLNHPSAIAALQEQILATLDLMRTSDNSTPSDQ